MTIGCGNLGAPPQPPVRVVERRARGRPRRGPAPLRASARLRSPSTPEAARGARWPSATAVRQLERAGLDLVAPRRATPRRPPPAPGGTTAGRGGAGPGSRCRRRTGARPGVRKTLIGQPPCPVSDWTASMYSASTSGRSSRSTLIATKPAFSSSRRGRILERLALPSRGTSGRRRSRPTGRSADRASVARSSASAPQGYQSTGSWACWSR